MLKSCDIMMHILERTLWYSTVSIGITAWLVEALHTTHLAEHVLGLVSIERVCSEMISALEQCEPAVWHNEVTVLFHGTYSAAEEQLKHTEYTMNNRTIETYEKHVGMTLKQRLEVKQTQSDLIYDETEIDCCDVNY